MQNTDYTAMNYLHYFREMSQCVDNLYCWTYDLSGSLLFSNCPCEPIFHSLFMQCGFFDKILHYAKENDAPYGLGTYMGLEWFAVLEKKEDILQQIHLLGPVLFSPIDQTQMELFLRDYEERSGGLHSKYILLKAIEPLPVVFRKQFGQLALMLHYTVNGIRLPYNALHFLIDRQLDETHATSPGLYRDIYLQTKELFEHLRKGIMLPEKQIENKFYALLPTNAARIHKPLRQLKDSAVIFAAQCANTAVEGGVSPETAYALADYYMENIEKNRSSVELVALISSTYSDFLKEVRHAQEQKTTCSEDIKTCIEYIRRHPEEDLSIPHLAKLVGYSTYYLSRKFKAETGIPLPEYIRRQRIEYSAMILRTTSTDLGTIAERLHFCSRSHFSDTFHKMMGITPSQYRVLHSGKQDN